MKQITNKEYEEWQKYKAEKAKDHVLLPDTVRFICEANGYDAEKIGQHFLEILPKICSPEERSHTADLLQRCLCWWKCSFFSGIIQFKSNERGDHI